MILVNVRRHGDEIMELDVSGHAGQAPRGEDLVCAGGCFKCNRSAGGWKLCFIDG